MEVSANVTTAAATLTNNSNNIFNHADVPINITNDSSNSSSLNQLQSSSPWNISVTLFHDIVPGPGSSFPQIADTFQGLNVTEILSHPFLFSAYSDELGWEPWIIDRDTETTYLLGDLNPGPGNSTYDRLPSREQDYGKTSRAVRMQVVWLNNGNAYFVADTPDYGTELWMTDGTSNNTKLFLDLFPGTNSSSPHGLLGQGGDYFLFTAQADDPTKGRQLYRSDGTVNGTFVLKEIAQDVAIENMYARLPKKNLLLFLARYETIPGNSSTDVMWQLWATDGTTTGTFSLHEPNQPNIPQHRLTSIWPFNDDEIYFEAANTTIGTDGEIEYNLDTYGLWKTDGTIDGTLFVTKPSPRRISFQMVQNDTMRLFETHDDFRTSELWVTDGSAAGTTQLIGQSDNLDILSIGPKLKDENSLIFWAENEESLLQLWKSDGTKDGTVVVHNNTGKNVGLRGLIRFPEANVVMWAVMGRGRGGERALWMTDGTTYGTAKVYDFDEEDDGVNSFGPYFRSYPLNEKSVLVKAYTNEHGFEWYKVELHNLLVADQINDDGESSGGGGANETLVPISSNDALGAGNISDSNTSGNSSTPAQMQTSSDNTTEESISKPPISNGTIPAEEVVLPTSSVLPLRIIFYIWATTVVLISS